MEVKNFKKKFQDKLYKQRITARTDANAMLNFYVDQEKLKDYRVCFSKQLKGFKNKKYVSKLCKHYYGSYVNTSD